MSKKYAKPIVVLSILSITVAAFIWYYVAHPSVKQQLQQTSPQLIALLLTMYLGTIGALVAIFAATLRLCKIRMPLYENLLVTAYSSVINFFGPLQSGPAFRAVYLKKKYDVKLINYTAATFVYYFFYGLYSGIFLLSGVLHWWLLLLLPVGMAAIGYSMYNRRIRALLSGLDLRAWYYLALATFAQVLIVTAIYYTELHSISPDIQLSQAIIYAGAANLALFVSLTPGAIGFRESFLLFSQHLHHIPTSTIVAANILDRTMYILLLGILAVFIFGTHARSQLSLRGEKR